MVPMLTGAPEEVAESMPEGALETTQEGVSEVPSSIAQRR